MLFRGALKQGLLRDLVEISVRSPCVAQLEFNDLTLVVPLTEVVKGFSESSRCPVAPLESPFKQISLTLLFGTSTLPRGVSPPKYEAEGLPHVVKLRVAR